MYSYKRPAEVLRSIGMHPKYKGYAYILCILRTTQHNPSLIYNLSRELYPLVMNEYGVSMAGVERNIRFAIRRTWEEGNHGVLETLFGAYEMDWIPTNSEFIAVITEGNAHAPHCEIRPVML